MVAGFEYASRGQPGGQRNPSKRDHGDNEIKGAGANGLKDTIKVYTA